MTELTFYTSPQGYKDGSCGDDAICIFIAQDVEIFCSQEPEAGQYPCSINETFQGYVNPGSPLDDYLRRSLGYTDDEIEHYIGKLHSNYQRGDRYLAPFAPRSPLYRGAVGGSEIRIMGFAARELQDSNYVGPAGLALGYIWKDFENLRDQSHRTTYGVHVDVPFIWNKLSLGFVNPSLTVEADLGFPKIEATIGAGPGLHFLFPGLIQLYGKFMVDGHLAQLGDRGQAGWSASAAGGIAAGFGLTLYVEGRTAVAGSEELAASTSLHGGLRLFF